MIVYAVHGKQLVSIVKAQMLAPPIIEVMQLFFSSLEYFSYRQIGVIIRQTQYSLNGQPRLPYPRAHHMTDVSF